MSAWPYYLQHTKYRLKARTDAIVLHHSAGPADQTIDAIRRFHVENRGWADIAYHYLIRLGEVHVGRPEWAVGAHAPGWNSRSTAICLVGTYSPQSPPDARQLDALCSTVVHLRGKHRGARIIDHRQAMAEVGKPGHTDCPGLDLAALVLARLPIRLEPDDPMRRSPEEA